MVATKVTYHSRFFVQVGQLLLMKCFENFDFENTSFPKYASFWFSVFISVLVLTMT